MAMARRLAVMLAIVGEHFAEDSAVEVFWDSPDGERQRVAETTGPAFSEEVVGTTASDPPCPLGLAGLRLFEGVHGPLPGTVGSAANRATQVRSWWANTGARTRASKVGGRRGHASAGSWRRRGGAVPVDADEE